MASKTVRYAAHDALIRLEWVSKHVVSRPDTREVRERLPDELEEIERFLVRVIGGHVNAVPRKYVHRKEKAHVAKRATKVRKQAPVLQPGGVRGEHPVEQPSGQDTPVCLQVSSVPPLAQD